MPLLDLAPYGLPGFAIDEPEDEDHVEQIGSPTSSRDHESEYDLVNFSDDEWPLSPSDSEQTNEGPESTTHETEGTEPAVEPDNLAIVPVEEPEPVEGPPTLPETLPPPPFREPEHLPPPVVYLARILLYIRAGFLYPEFLALIWRRDSGAPPNEKNRI